jgi:hypothetical protein
MKNKLTTWIKRHKAWSVVIAIVIIFGVIGATTDSNATTTQTKSIVIAKKSPPSKSTPSTNTTSATAQIPYKVTEDDKTTVGILIDPQYNTTVSLTELGKQLRAMYGSREEVTVFVFDSQDAASLLDTVKNGSDTDAQDAVYDPHFISEYSRNGSSGLDQTAIQLQGVDGSTSEVNY